MMLGAVLVLIWIFGMLLEAYFTHRERMLLIRMGINPEEKND